MSKVVKGVGRTIGKIQKGVMKAINTFQKKVRSSKIGKILIGAALVYFGGAALMGAMGGATAGAAAGSGVMGTVTGAVSGGLSGAAAGISSAWGGLTGALGAGSLSGAASSLGSGFTGAYGAGAGAVTGAAGAAGTGLATGAADSAFLQANMGAGAPIGSGLSNSTIAAGTNTSVAGLNAAAQSPGLIGNAMSGARQWWGNLAPAEKVLAAQAGTGLASTGFKAIGAYQNNRQARDMYNRQRSDYNTNIGTRIWE